MKFGSAAKIRVSPDTDTHTLEKNRKRPHQLMSKEQIRKKTYTGRQLDRNYNSRSGQKLRKKTEGKKQQPLGFAFSKAQFK